MKKIFLSLLILFVVVGCDTTSKNKELLCGEWSYSGKSGFDSAFFYYKFNEDGTFEHFKCMGSECELGDAEWNGTYKLDGNRIELNVTNENQKILRYGSFKISIEESLVADFDNMYLCDGDEGLDCSQQYEK